MKEEILNVLKHAGRSLDLMEIAYAVYNNPGAKEIGIVSSLLSTLISDYEVEINRKGKYQICTLVRGRLALNPKGFGFVCPDEGDDFHISRNNLNGALDGDIVVMEKISDPQYKNEGRILKVVKRNAANLVGEIYFENGQIKVKLNGNDMKVNLEVEDPNQYVAGQIVLLEETKVVNKKTINAKIKATIGFKGEPLLDVKVIALKYGIRLDFPEEVLEEVTKIPMTVSPKEMEGRTDLRDLDIFTIDGDDTKDIDDAIYAERLEDGKIRMLVAIADVSHYVKNGSAIHEEAMLRGTSNYLTSNYVIPMLDQHLSNGICSLNPDVDRLAVAFDMIIDEKGDTVSFDMYDAVIRSRKKMTYKEVNKLFNGNPSEDYKPYESTLWIMKEAADRVRAYRDRKGQLDFDIDEAKIILDEKGVPVEIKRAERGVGEKLIEDFMVTTNIAYGTYMLNMGVAALFRVHDRPSEERVNEFLKFASLLGISIKGNLNKEELRSKDIQKLLEQIRETNFFEICSKKLLRSQRKAEYSPINIGHFALAVSPMIGYIQITSPIRRGPDLINHEIGKELRHNPNFLIDEEKMEELEAKLVVLGEHLSKMERNAEQCEREVDAYEMAYYMESRIGEQFEGTIDGLISKGFFVQTDNLIDGLVPSNTLPGNYVYNEQLMAFTSPQDHRGFRLGDKVTVECTAANKEERTIDFKLVLQKGDKNGNNQ